jgi:hypothetical protein
LAAAAVEVALIVNTRQTAVAKPEHKIPAVAAAADFIPLAEPEAAEPVVLVLW